MCSTRDSRNRRCYFLPYQTGDQFCSKLFDRYRTFVLVLQVGISALCIFSAEIIAVVVLKYFVDTFDEAIEQTTTDLFDSVNFVQEEARTRLADYVTSSGEHFVYKDGWSVVGHEDSTNQRYIDFIQTIVSVLMLSSRFKRLSLIVEVLRFNRKILLGGTTTGQLLFRRIRSFQLQFRCC